MTTRKTSSLKGSKSPHIFRHLIPAKPTVVYETYWRFAAERQAIFFKRAQGATSPWTNDPILKQYKFTNVYRASDRVSQYLIRNVIYRGDQSATEVFFRIVLFKVFNKIETWQLLERKLSTITYSEYSFNRYDEILNNALKGRLGVFSGAYIMPSGCSSFGHRQKHRNLLMLIENMMADNIPLRITETFSMQKAFELLRSYPMLGDFLAYQLVTDINYSELTNFTEMDFVVPGPGARNGIRKCFESIGGLNEVEIIRLMVDKQEDEFKHFGLEFKSLWGRPLHLIDCQNLFCEVDKYARIAHPEIKGASKRKRIKQLFRPKQDQIEYWYPPKWGLNKYLQAQGQANDKDKLF
ncbi:nucleotide kinase domain-containing protein [Planctomycetota bacterium]